MEVNDFKVSSKRVKDALTLMEIEHKGEPVLLSLEFFLRTFFPQATQRLNKNFKTMYTKGFIDGQKTKS